MLSELPDSTNILACWDICVGVCVSAWEYIYVCVGVCVGECTCEGVASEGGEKRGKLGHSWESQDSLEPKQDSFLWVSSYQYKLMQQRTLDAMFSLWIALLLSHVLYFPKCPRHLSLSNSASSGV